MSLSNHRAPGADARQVIDLSENGEFPTREEVETQGDVPQRFPTSGPDMVDDLPSFAELFPEPGRGTDGSSGQPEMEVSPAVSQAGENAETAGMESAEGPDAADVHLPDEDVDDSLFGDEVCFFAHPSENQAWEIQLHETDVPFADLPSPEQALNYVLLATPERKKRVEVKLRDLTPEECGQFKQAKDKEVKAWLDHWTVKRVAGGTLDDSQLMRCRWVLTWKNPEKPRDAKRPKARLVVLGFEDPDLSTIPNDAPTLGKDARQLIIQKVKEKGMGEDWASDLPKSLGKP